jgi:hypothetical protein
MAVYMLYTGRRSLRPRPPELTPRRLCLHYRVEKYLYTCKPLVNYERPPGASKYRSESLNKSGNDGTQEVTGKMNRRRESNERKWIREGEQCE